MRVNGFVIMATRSMRSYASRVAAELSKYPRTSSAFGASGRQIDATESLRVDSFADGEMEVTVLSSIRGKDVYLFASAARNEAGSSVVESKEELYHTVDALKRAQAERIVVLEPYVSCSRSDRTDKRNSVGLWVHFKILASLGVDHIITFQLHSDKSKSMLDPTLCFIDDVPAFQLLKQRLVDLYVKDLETLERVVRPTWAFCSVDAGGEKLARRFANAFGCGLVIAHKQRDYSRKNTVEAINILSAEPVKDKVLWIVDDMVDTGSSVERLILTLAELEPREINLAAVHPVFSGPAEERLAALCDKGILKHILVSDTVACPECFSESLPGLEVVSSVSLSAGIIAALVQEGSLSDLFAPFDAESYLKEPRLL